jgi:hypothetical protein
VRRTLLLVVLALGVAAAPSALAAGPKKAITPGFFRGKAVGYLDFGPIKLKAGNKVAPLWTITNGAGGQHNVIDTVPGRPDYSPLWQINKVRWKAAVTPRLLKSAAAVKAAAASGDVTIQKTSLVVNCPVLGFGQKRVAGFSGGRVIHYLDLGPVKVAPGNEVVPLYAPTNGAAGQHNVTHDTLAPGQTDYPPPWGIAKVTWKPGAHKRLLKSYAQIAAAKKAGELTLQPMSLVVNCPIVP